MRKHFVILLNNETPLEQRAISEALTNSRLLWWHWIQHAWLVVSPDGKGTAAMIRGIVTTYVEPSRVSVAVLQVTPEDWAIWTAERAHPWLEQNWSKQPGANPTIEMLREREANGARGSR